MSTRFLQRYDAAERTNHWALVLLFFCAALSGLAFFHPAFYFLVNLFGGGPWARILHPFFGLGMAASFLGIYLKLAPYNRMTDADREWSKHAGAMLRGDKSAMPPAGRYNGGQKRVFWLMVWSLVVLVVTGITFWQPWFAGYFPILVRRIAVVLHAASATILILTTIVHIYAAIWVKGTIRAMTRGTVSEGWAKQNHALWYKEVSGK
jgi:formate dehydrogenase subunit gamma